MKNTTLFILAVALFGVMEAVSFLKAERASRRSTPPVEESLRSAPPRAVAQDAQLATPDKSGTPPLGVGLVDNAQSATSPTPRGGAPNNSTARRGTPVGEASSHQVLQPETIVDKTRTASDAAVLTTFVKDESGQPATTNSAGKEIEFAPLTLAAIKLDIDANGANDVSGDGNPAVGASIQDIQSQTEGQTESKAASSEFRNEAKSKEDEILDYFQERLDQLPDDLTSYEKRVAIKEVRDEVLEVFKITLSSLNKLTKNRKIKYP
ncbi:MAG: hypothetical protein IH914_01280 [candidate division Zixibacteria bacterium]|nr:hypothetical protein [candidate division Zixibacteria bacterium]